MAHKVNLDELRYLLMNDLWFLTNFLSPFKGEQNNIDEGFHKELASFVSTWKEDKKRKLYIAPRGILKTTFLEAEVIRLILNDPNVMIFWGSEERQQSAKSLALIRTILETNTILIKLFGKFQGSVGWKSDEITIKQRTKQGLREPTLSIAGTDSAITGGHHDFYFLNDLVGETNTRTPEQFEKTIGWYQKLDGLILEHSRVIMNGTFWGDADLYNYILQYEKERYETLIVGAYTPYGETRLRKDEKGKVNLLCPKILPEKVLDDKRKHNTPHFFSAQWLSQIIPKGQEELKYEWLRWWTPDDLPKNIAYYMTFDLASSLERDACDTAIVVGGVDVLFNLYLITYQLGKMNTDEVINAILTLHHKYRPRRTGTEKGTEWNFISQALEKKMRQQSYFIKVEELVHAGAKAESKKARIRASLIPRASNHALYVNKSMTEFIMQYRRFPHGKTMDLLDAVAMLEEILRPNRQIDKPLWQKRDRSMNLRHYRHSVTGY